MASEDIHESDGQLDPDWIQEIEDSQKRPHYTIDGKNLERIRFGDEEDDWGADEGPCHDCGAKKGQFHVWRMCDVERCPICGGQAISCECDVEDDDED